MLNLAVLDLPTDKRSTDCLDLANIGSTIGMQEVSPPDPQGERGHQPLPSNTSLNQNAESTKLRNDLVT